MDRREPLPAGAQLLHPAARPRGAAARHLYRLADAQDQGRPVRRHAVRAARPDRHHGAVLDLRAARQGHDRPGPVLRPEGRRPRRSWSRRCCASASGRSRTTSWWRWRRRPSSPSSSTTCRSPSSSSAPASSATLAGAPAWSPSWPAAATARSAPSRSPTRDSLLGEETPDACQAQSALVALHHRGLPGAMAGAGGRALSRPGRRQRLHQDRDLLQQDGRGHLRRRLCRAGLCRPAGGRALSLGDSRARCWTGSAWPRRRPAR